jgi:hypothetical protein
MPRFIAVHPVALKDEEMIALLARRDELPSTLVWRTSFVAEANRMTYCEWDAPEASLLEEVFEAFGIPFSAVHEVRVFDPAAQLSKAA